MGRPRKSKNIEKDLPSAEEKRTASEEMEEADVEIADESVDGALDEIETGPGPEEMTDARPAPRQGVEKRMFSESEMQEMIARAVAEAMTETSAQRATGQSDQDDMVTVLYLDECSNESTLELPGYGTMRPYSYLEVPKREFGNKFMSALARKLIDRRKLLVMNGLTREERVRWNCDYKEGEVLDERTFDLMLDYQTPELCAIFEKLCPEHQRFVACRMITAKEKGDNRISMEKAKKINELSKKNEPNGMLLPVLRAFGAEIAG